MASLMESQLTARQHALIKRVLVAGVFWARP